MTNPARPLQFWTVYDRPKDYPDGYVARLHLIEAGATTPTDRALYGPTLQSVRAQLPPWLIRIERSPEDEPQIVESWA